MSRWLLISKLLLPAAMVALARPAHAEPPPPVDVRIQETPQPQRTVTVAWNPLPLLIGKLSADVVITPTDHHALVVSPFYVWAKTAPIYVFDDGGNATQLPEQKFNGAGAELGYRYYSGLGGPRGFFAGPSLILGEVTATAQNGSKTSFLDLGGAIDAGYEVLVADRISLALGGGIQYLTTSEKVPNQQFPARIYANSGLGPRFLFSIGWAL